MPRALVLSEPIVGAMLGPVMLTTLFASGPGWRTGYAILAGLLAWLTLVFALNVRQFAPPPRGGRLPEDAAAAARASAGFEERLVPPARPRIALGLALFFAYTGLEAACGQWAYSFLTEGRALGAHAAGFAVAGYWGALG